MSYDPTEWAPQTPGQQPAQPSVTPSAYGQAPQPPVPPAQGQVAPTQYSAQPPQPGQSNPGFPPYGQQPQPQPGQSNPGFPPYGQQPQPGQSNPGFPPYGQPPQPGQSNPGLPQYGQPQQAAYGQSNPGFPPYGAPADPYAPQPSNPSLPPFGAPGEQYGQPQQQPWGAAVPPGYLPPVAPPKKGGAKIGVIILVIVLILAIVGGGGGYVLYQNTRPKPVITLTSKYLDGATSVGATSTSFTLKGTDFTSSSAITFLLDGHPVDGAPSVQSDSNGKVSATLTVTSAWSVGTHTLTAKDASNYLTKTGVKIEIVTPGKSNTPGPSGAPTDSANMTIVATIQGGTSTLTVKSGSVCGDKDTGQPQTGNGTATNGVTFTTAISLTCTGTYQGGKLTYTETATSLKFVYSDGLICSSDKSFVYRHMEGTFTSSTSVNGSYSTDPIVVNCNLGVGSLTALSADQGTWTGVAAVS